MTRARGSGGPPKDPGVARRGLESFRSAVSDAWSDLLFELSLRSRSRLEADLGAPVLTLDDPQQFLMKI